MPRDPQGAETRKDAELLREVVAWLRNKENKSRMKRTKLTKGTEAWENADRAKRYALIAARIVEDSIPPHAGEETKG